MMGFSGCPNNCAHAAVADIGLTGTKKKVDGERVQCFRLLAGGGLGKSPGLGTELHAAVPQPQAASVIRWLVEQYADSTCHSMTEFVNENSADLQNEAEQFIKK